MAFLVPVFPAKTKLRDLLVRRGLTVDATFSHR